MKKTADGDDIDAIKSAVEELQQAAQAFAALYQQAGAEGAGASEPEAAGATAGGGDDDVIDAEFEKK